MSEKDTPPALVIPPETVTGAPLVPVLSPAEAFRAWLEGARARKPANTIKAWESDLRALERWGSQNPLPPYTPFPVAVAAFLRALHTDGCALATIKRRLATLVRVAQAGGMASPAEAECVREVMEEAAHTRKGQGQKQAPGLGQREADRIAGAVQDGGPKAVRDVAVMLVGRDLLARADELVRVAVEDVSWDEEDGTATVSLLRGKTHQERETYMLGSDAAEAMRRWLEVSGIKAGPVFVSLEKSGKPRLTDGAVRPLAPREVARIIKGLGKLAGLNADFSAHSLRVGMAQDLVAAGIEAAEVMQAAGWKSPTMLTRYTRKQNAKRGAVAKYYAHRHK